MQTKTSNKNTVKNSSIATRFYLRSLFYSLLPVQLKKFSDGPRVSPRLNRKWKIDENTKYEKVDFRNLLEKTKNPKIGLVCLERDDATDQFKNAIQELGLEGEVFNAHTEKLIDKIAESKVKLVLIRPEYKTQIERQLFNEITSELNEIEGIKIYPRKHELEIYENKIKLAYFLSRKKIKHPETRVFFNQSEAIEYIDSTELPLVFKTARGASGSGVEILTNTKSARKLIKILFNGRYYPRRVFDLRDFDYGYAIFQEFISSAREFRVIKIGKSWFGHEKRASSKSESSAIMSGSGANDWTPPTAKLLDLCEKIASDNKFETMCMDIFLDDKGHFYVNELQCWFGSYNPSQMYIDGKPGRYIKESNEWKFDQGYYNENGSMTLRIVEALNSYHQEVEQ